MFKYFENTELDLDKVYLQKCNSGLSFVKLFKYNGIIYTNHPLQYKATTVQLIEFEKVVGMKVSGYNSNGVFVGKITYPVLPIGKFNFKDSCFIFWEGQQKNKPMGWQNINYLKFL